MSLFCIANIYYRKATEMFKELRPRKSEGLNLLMKASELGHKTAKAQIAWEKLYGTDLPQNITEAKEIFEELAVHGIPEAHMVRHSRIIEHYSGYFRY